MRWLLRLYPAEWRERYEDEMLAVLEQHDITGATVLDLLIGAIDANLTYHGSPKGVKNMIKQLRSGMVMVFCAFVLFGLGWSLLQRINDPVNLFQIAAQSHPELVILHQAVFVGGCLAFLALVVGGLPMFILSVHRAIKGQQKTVLKAFVVALSCLILFLISTGILADWHQIPFAKAHMYIFLISYCVVFLILLTIGTVSVSLILSRSDLRLTELKLMFIPEIIIVFSMVISVILSTVFILALIAYAPQLFQTQDTGSLMFVTGIFLMALGTIFSGIGLKRGMNRELKHIIGE